jgi:broad specificity phosphatase PhoE
MRSPAEGSREFQPDRRETEKPYSSRIIVNVFRHGQKEKLPPEGVGGDEAIRLTPQGREQAQESGAAFRQGNTDIDQRVAIGSPRTRAQETAGFAMAGHEAGITGDETVAELKVKLDGERAYGTKLGQDARLDFEFGAGSFEEAANKAYGEGRLLSWLANESDDLARAEHEQRGLGYTRMAGNVAELIHRYVRAAPRFDQLVKEKDYGDTLERFLGTHQAVGESFVARALEKMRGAEARDQFIAALGDVGFNFVEGFKVEIDTPAGGGEPTATLTFSRPATEKTEAYELSLPLSGDLLKEMIEDRRQLDRELAAAAS